MADKINYDWLKIIEDWRSSQLSMARFCTQKNIPLSSFYKAKKKISTLQTSPKLDSEIATKPEISFLEVTHQEVPTQKRRTLSQAVIKLILPNGCVVEVPIT